MDIHYIMIDDDIYDYIIYIIYTSSIVDPL